MVSASKFLPSKKLVSLMSGVADEGEVSLLTKRLDPPAVSAVLRARLGAPHKQLHDQVINCPGCKMALTNDTMTAHLSGCTHIGGNNSASAHRIFKNSVKRIAMLNGVAKAREHSYARPASFS